MQLRPLEDELRKIAEDELNEVPDRIKEDLDHILEWVKKEPHLNIRKDEQWLIAYLRGCKFSLQRTKEKLDYFYTLKSLMPEQYTNRDPMSPEIQAFLKIGTLLALPRVDSSCGFRIVLLRFKDADPNKMALTDMMKLLTMVVDVLLLEDDRATVAGIFMLIDYADFSLNYMLQYTPNLVQKMVMCMQSGYPLRIKGMYCINAPSVFEIVFNMAASFMNDKLRSRLRMYKEGNSNKIYDEIPQAMLPREYGGKAGSVEKLAVEWKQKIEGYKDWFLEDENYRSTESLRIGKPKTSADVFGVEGTFRKLAID